MKIVVKILKYLSFSFLLFAALILAAVPNSIYEMPNDLSPVGGTQDILLDKVNYVDVNTGQMIRNPKIHISNGKILYIEPRTSNTHVQAKVIDLDGAYVVPGLFDMHVHDRKYLGLYLAYGVTSVRNMRGLPMHLRWKDELKNMFMPFSRSLRHQKKYVI